MPQLLPCGKGFGNLTGRLDADVYLGSKEVDVNAWIAVILIVLVVVLTAGVAALLVRSRRRQRPARIGLSDLGTLAAEHPDKKVAPPKERAISLSGRNAQRLVDQAVLRSSDQHRNPAEASTSDNVQGRS